MRIHLLRVALCAGAAWAGAACSDSSATTGGAPLEGGTDDAIALTEGGVDAGIDPSKRLADLTPAERAMLCDWTAAQFGGYGRTVNCAAGLDVTSHKSQSDCVAFMAETGVSCSATVGDHETCTVGALATMPCVDLPPQCFSVLFCA